MEIKIKCYEQENEVDTGRTYLFEGTHFIYKFCHYNNLNEFRERWKEVGQGKNGSVLGIPEFFWDEKGDQNSHGDVLLINYYDEGNEFNFIIVKNATVFITSKGQTIDKIMVA